MTYVGHGAAERVGRTMDGMEIVVPLFVLAVIGLGVWFWVWLYRWATDVRDSLRQIAAATGGVRPDTKGLMKPVAPGKHPARS